MSRFVFVGLLVLAACAPPRFGLRGECVAGCAQIAAVEIGMAVVREATAEPEGPLCDDNDPPHTCPGMTPGPVAPPAPRD